MCWGSVAERPIALTNSSQVKLASLTYLTCTYTTSGHALVCYPCGFMGRERNELRFGPPYRWGFTQGLCSQQLKQCDHQSISNFWATQQMHFCPSCFLHLPSLLPFHPRSWQEWVCGLLFRVWGGIKVLSECRMLPGARSLGSPLFRA